MDPKFLMYLRTLTCAKIAVAIHAMVQSLSLYPDHVTAAEAITMIK